MPCDTTYDESNVIVFDGVLRDISIAANTLNINHIVCGGDFNTDISRSNSLHTKSLMRFVQNEHMILLDDLPNNSVDYTFESKIDQTRSTIDHFIVSDNVFPDVTTIFCDHNVHNLSDHSSLGITLNVNVSYIEYIQQDNDTLLWSNASDAHIERYKHELDTLLSSCIVPTDALYCTDHFCSKHNFMIQDFHDSIINACIQASQCIPTKKCNRKYIPGWNEYIVPYRDRAMLWHNIWKDNGRPRSGIVADIRARTRASYHNIIKSVKRNENNIRACNMAKSFFDIDKRNFWTEIKKLRGKTCNLPSSIDGEHGERAITELFANKYENLYKSVPYDKDDMCKLKQEIDDSIRYDQSVKVT